MFNETTPFWCRCRVRRLDGAAVSGPSSAARDEAVEEEKTFGLPTATPKDWRPEDVTLVTKLPVVTFSSYWTRFEGNGP